MHITLHLTNRCNLRCRYCYAAPGQADMTPETALRAIELLATERNCGIIFFGGEPLLARELIATVIAECERAGPNRFHYKMTTNGTLLDPDFLDQADANHLGIAVSHDGTREAHDANRVDTEERGTFDRLEPKLRLLLQRRPYAPVMLVVDPAETDHYAAGVRRLYGLGARYLICSLNHAGGWDDRGFARLRRQYDLLADWYLERYKKGEKVYFSPFDKRIGERIADRPVSCRLGMRQISVGPDGVFYPCVQFVGRREYAIGDVAAGLDESRRAEIFRASEADRPGCAECALRDRCHNKCGCLSLQVTGDPFRVPAVVCEHERMLLPLADRLAEELYASRNPLFLQRNYNSLFPILSFLEDISGT